MPEFVGQRGDLPLIGFMRDRCGAPAGPGVLMFLLCVQVSLVRVLKGLSGALMSGQVIFFSVMLGAGAMGVDGKVVVLRGDLL